MTNMPLLNYPSQDGGNKLIKPLDFCLLMPEKRVSTLECKPGFFYGWDLDRSFLPYQKN